VAGTNISPIESVSRRRSLVEVFADDFADDFAGDFAGDFMDDFADDFADDFTMVAFDFIVLQRS
jgi:hypothetical protein